MENNLALDKVINETLCFLRGKYCLDEISDGKFTIWYKNGQKTIVTIDIHREKLVFLIIFGKEERAKFERELASFSSYIRDYYDSSNTFHDGKWMYINVTSLKQLDEVKKLILIKKKPNRKPLSKENAIFSKCGHRCDLCLHYTGIDESTRKKYLEACTHVYGDSDWSMRCSGCDTLGCHNKINQCEQLKCAYEKGYDSCTSCNHYPCINATVGYNKLEPRSLSSDDITYGILPFVPHQYGN